MAPVGLYTLQDEEVKDEEVQENASASADQIADLESCEQWDEGLEPKCELDPYLADLAGTKDEEADGLKRVFRRKRLRMCDRDGH